MIVFFMNPTMLNVGSRNYEYKQRDQWHTHCVRSDCDQSHQDCA